jgi:hypothetical protein
LSVAVAVEVGRGGLDVDRRHGDDAEQEPADGGEPRAGGVLSTPRGRVVGGGGEGDQSGCESGAGVGVDGDAVLCGEAEQGADADWDDGPGQ